MTHDIGNPPPYRYACRELYRHAARLRYEQPIPLPPRRHGLALAVALWALGIVLAVAMTCEFHGF